MDTITRTNWKNLRSQEGETRYKKFTSMLQLTDSKVEWAYEVWDDLLEELSHRDNHQRAIASQLLCSLAKSDPKNRMLKDFDAILAVTRDERFVTARHTLQAIWKVGAAIFGYIIGAGREMEAVWEKLSWVRRCRLMVLSMIETGA